eukprot:m.211287 g.211287  ORF g.211287 m.211287 type:complete len:147 (+) comp18103_c0_seq1:70-510(+)
MDESEIQKNFALFDKKGDEKINLSELGTVLRALGQNPTQADVAKIVQDFDPNGEGGKRISFQEFLPVFNSMKNKKEQGTSADFVEGLRVFDKEGNGTINAAELRHVLTSLGEKLSDEDVDTLLANANVDNQGQIKYEEFVNMVMSG